MSILPASGVGEVSTGFYNNVATQSLRYNDGSSSHLTFTTSSASSATDRRKVTHAVWIKRGDLGTAQSIYSTTKSGGGDYYLWRFNTDDTMTIFLDVSSGNFAYDGSEIYRDTTNWYHFVLIIDTTQSSASDRIKLYKNGELQTLSNKYGSDVSQNFSTYVMDGTEDAIGQFNFNSTTYFDGYMCDFITTIGQDNSISDFGETVNDVWIAKNYSGSYGANGFRLEFKQTGTGTASTSTIGADTSGNTNHWTSNNLNDYDSNFFDAPENNFATALGSIAESDDYQGYDKPTSAEGNLKMTANSSGWTNGGSNFGMTSGKWYAEVIVNSWVASNYVRIGLRAKPARTYDEYFVLGNGTGQLDAASRNGRLPAFSTGDVIQLALDLENQAFYLGKNGTWGNSATETEIENGTTTNAFASGAEVPLNDGRVYFFYAQPHPTGTTITWNFGQDSSFAGAKTAQGNSDGGDSNTDFYYTPPSGFLACNNINLPEVTLSAAQDEQPKDYVNTVLYNGDGNSTNDITGVGFQPDWTWIKERSSDGSHIADHVLVDSSRGYENFLVSSSSQAQSSGVTGNNSTRSSDGFQTTNSGASNQNGQPYVAWNWRINGGTTSTDTNGSLNSTVQVNTTAGISIARFNNPTQGNFSVGHGLGSTPESFWFKAENTVMNWIVYHHEKSTSVPDSTGLYLNSSLAGFSTGNWITGLTDTTISIADGMISSGNNINYYIISFKEVEGFSKFGIYDGVSNANGTVVFTGFRPAIVIFKALGADDWVIADNARDPSNTVVGQLFPSSTIAESRSNNICDFLSNGFKLRRSAGSINQDGRNYIYYAWAEQAFKFSNAR